MWIITVKSYTLYVNMSESYLSELELILSKNDEYTVEGKLNKNKIAELAHKYDENLIDLLASESTFRKLFFVTTKSKALVFNKDKFIQFINNKEFLPDSFTAYKNRIGLATGTELLSENKEVVLNWAYKDCVLEGGQDKEDAKRDEVFHNEILAPDQIDRLLDEKVLTGWKRYDKNGEHLVKDIKQDDNLIIRGNNLLVLHSLKNKYAGKIKLIYIDPPYNTGNDSFGYNDKFSHSAWLTFMKNRLEVARHLLSEDGVIFVQADYNEAHYLKILLDEIFGRKCFINEIIWKRKFGTANETKRFATAFDNIFLYSKSDNYKINLIKEKNSKHTQEYIKSRFTRKDLDGPHKGRLWMPYPLANPGKPTKNLSYEYKGYSAPAKGWRMVKEALAKLDEDNRIYFPKDKSQRLQEKKFLDEYDGQPVDALWNDIFVINSQSGEALDFDGQKPEALLQRIISIGSEPGDTVLDYHLGSGTTAAVAHKMNRHYIGIEQLQYGEKDAVNRLKSVIKGDKNGISNDVGWSGGGSFTYAHLTDLGNKFIQKVKNASTDKELVELLEQAKKSSFLSYKVDPEKINPGDKDFKDLSIAHKKQLLLELVDQNHLYVNYSEIDDSDFGVSTEDKELNNQFYGK